MVATDRKRHEWNAQVLPSLRMRVSAARVRVPDLCLISNDAPKEQVLTHPPLVAIEVLDEGAPSVTRHIKSTSADLRRV